MKTRFCSALCAFAGLLLLAPVSNAADPAPGGVLDQVWIITPKNGMDQQFQKAFAAHVQWRRDNKDPWSWEVYSEAVGPEPGILFARSANHSWADFDAYEATGFPMKAGEQWDTTVAPFVANVRNSISEYEPSMSHWPKDAPEYTLFTLITYQLKQGAGMKFRTTTEEIAKALAEAKWPNNWAFLAYHTGPQPSQLLVLPAANWAGFKDPDPNVYNAVVSVRGAEAAGKLFADYGSCVAHQDAIIIRRLPQFSVTGTK